MTPVYRPNVGRVLLVLAGLAVAPVLLTAWIGAPIPHHWPTAEQIDTLLRGVNVGHLHALLRIVVWAAWLAILIGTVWEVTTYLAHRQRHSAPTRRPWFLRLTGGLALGATATTSLAATTTTVAAANDAPGTAADEQRNRHKTTQAASTPRSEPTDEVTTTVKGGDTLSGIAEDELDDPNAWPKIFDHNKNQTQPDGGQLTDPDLIYPGWELTIPASQPLDKKPAPDDDETTQQDEPREFVKPPPQFDDESADTADKGANATADADAAIPAGVWWAGGFVATGFAAGIVWWVRRARHRVHEYEKRSHRPGPRIRLHEPLNELEALTGPSSSAEHDAAGPAALGVTDDGNTLSLHEAARGGLGLTGPGADAVARAAIAAALTAGDQDADAQACDVITTTTLLAQLLETTDASSLGIHRLWAYPTNDDALRALSRDLISRTRDPDEAPTVSVLAVLDDDIDRATLEPLLTQGEDHGLGALILGDWPDHTITVDTDGTTNDRAVNRCHFMTPDAFAATLSTLDEVAEAFDDPITPPPEAAPGNGTEAETRCEDDEPSLTEASTPASDTKPSHHDVGASHAGAVSLTNLDAPVPPETTGTLRLRLLGDFVVTLDGEPVRIRRSKCGELLAYLAAQPRASLESLLEAIVPETMFTKARGHFNTIVTYARKDLRAATGRTKDLFVLHNHGTYRLDPDWFTTDLHDFDHHITQAETTTNPTTRNEHLTAVLDLYEGEVAADIDSESTWLYPTRAHYADVACTACLTLADHAISNADTTTAVDLLERAITINNYTESAYNKLIDLHNEQGDRDSETTVKRRRDIALSHINSNPKTEWIQ